MLADITFVASQHSVMKDRAAMTSLIKRLLPSFAKPQPSSDLQKDLGEPSRGLNRAESHISIVFGIDESGSMREDASQAQKCIHEMFNTLRQMPSVARRVDVQVFTAGDRVERHGPFRCVLDAMAPQITIGGSTPLAAMSLMSLRSLQEWKRYLIRNEVETAAEIFVIVSDGHVTDKHLIDNAKQALRVAQTEVTILPFFCNGGSRDALEAFCGCQALRASETDIPELFRRLTDAIKTVSMASPRELQGPSLVRNLMFGGQDES